MSYPRWTHTPSKKARGKDKGGSALGWNQDSEQEKLPIWMRWTFLIDSDLAGFGPEWREGLKKQCLDNFQCIMSYRKDRHSERQMRIPYRVCIKGTEAPACTSWLIEEMCATDGIDIEDIWSLPLPEAAHQEEVWQRIDGIVIKVLADTSQRIDLKAAPP